MASVAEMGEVDDTVHSNDDSIKDGPSINGDCEFIDETEANTSNGESNESENEVETTSDPIPDDDDIVSLLEESNDGITVEKEVVTNHIENLEEEKTDSNTNEALSNKEDEEHLPNGILEINSPSPNGAEIACEEIISDDDNSTKDDNAIVINDSVENESILVIDDKDPIENGTIDSTTSDSTSSRSTPSVENQDNDINLDLGKVNVKKFKKKNDDEVPARRSSRKLIKERKKATTKIVELVKSKESNNDESESDIEEVMPEDPLADIPITSMVKKIPPKLPTIVVKDTKSLVDIASISKSSSNKSEPTLVIIDTNSILSGRGPIPVSHKRTPTISNSYPLLPMALPAQGIYPANMRATITPIPHSTSIQPVAPKSTTQTTPKQTQQIQVASPPVLPTLTDDMYVVEAPSFIVPYVYEKPPVHELKEVVKNLDTTIKADIKEDKKNILKREDKEEPVEDDEDDVKQKPIDLDKLPSMELPNSATLAAELKKPTTTYFDSPLGKFFMNIGSNLVQEMVQTDLLKQQKRKRDRESGSNSETLKTIHSLLKNLEFTKENNEPFHSELKKCEFCSFRTESALAMAFHLETPHMKNFVYRCNFCIYEVRSPHDILYHMEIRHGVRGRLERAPAFHQCPNCPFEDNQKGKLSRHLVACARKFKPERNLEPPIDYEPPAKIPRAPRMKQQGLGPAAAVYQAMARSSQFQMLTKVTTPPQNINALNRNRGRPTLGNVPPIKPVNVRSPSSMIFKSSNMSGGSVLLPSNYQLTGNQLYQVVGGPELGFRLGPGGSAAFLPSISTTANCMPIQASSPQSQPQHLMNKIKPSQQPSISITPLPRGAPTPAMPVTKPGDATAKNSFVICEICDGYIKDLEQLRNHMQWIHKVKIHPKMIYNRPPLNCQKCQFRFFTDQGLERHLLGSHGLVTSSMQEAANKSKDSGRCPVCGRVYQWKLLNHVARDHNMTLKPAHLSYKCTVCTATFGMYKQFESHVYSAHSVVAKRALDKKNPSPATSISRNESVLKPLKINDEITIIPQPNKSTNEEAGPSTSGTSVTIRNSIGQSNGSSEIHEVDDDSSSSSSQSREKRRKLSPSLSDN